MHKRFHVAAVLATLGLCSGVAGAVPVTFEFSGTVTGATDDQVGNLGAAASGRFVFETEGLARSISTSPVTSLTFGDSPANGGTLFSGDLTVNGVAYDTSGPNPWGYVNFFDGCTPACAPGFGESFSIWVNSRERPWTGPYADGIYHETQYAFLMSPPSPGGVPSNYFDLTDDFGVENVLTLPLYDAVVLWSDYVYECIGGECGFQSSSFLQINASQVTRSSAASVPEPGTLGLLGAALAGVFFVRRRREI